MAPPFFCGPGASLWLGMSLCQTHAEAHVANSARQAGAAANLAANNKVTKYDQLTRTHVFYPVAIETAAVPGWHYQVIELVEEIGKRTNITGDPKETAYLFQQLTVAFQRANAVSFQSTFAVS